MDKDQFDKVFKDKFENYSPRIDPSLKGNVFSSMPKSLVGSNAVISSILVGVISISTILWMNFDKEAEYLDESVSDIKRSTETKELGTAALVEAQEGLNQERVSSSEEFQAKNLALKESSVVSGSQSQVDNTEQLDKRLTDDYQTNSSEKGGIEIISIEPKEASWHQEEKLADIQPSIPEVSESNSSTNEEESKQGLLRNIGSFLLPKKNGLEGSIREPQRLSDSNEIVPKSKKRIPLHVFGELHGLMGYSNIDVNHTDNVFISDVQTEPVLSMDRVGLRWHLGIGKYVSPKLRVYAAFSGQLANYQFKYLSTTSVVDSTLFISSISDTGVSYEHEPQLGEIRHKQLSLGLTGGISFDYLRKDKLMNSMELSLGYFGNEGVREEFLRKDQLYFTFGHRTNVALSKKLSFVFVPSLSYSLLNNKSDYQLYLKPFSIGVGMGLVYRFSLGF